MVVTGPEMLPPAPGDGVKPERGLRRHIDCFCSQELLLSCLPQRKSGKELAGCSSISESPGAAHRLKLAHSVRQLVSMQRWVSCFCAGAEWLRPLPTAARWDAEQS